ncbi:hypothetical protein PLICRDRAFT_175090 [Plicaturopsis crispa FD-325 SS-3]|nr:hypothetical protein PLICRDRAFT_175090 [Plicaturopsis crispa FD-325 SS-3]
MFVLFLLVSSASVLSTTVPYPPHLCGGYLFHIYLQTTLHQPRQQRQRPHRPAFVFTPAPAPTYHPLPRLTPTPAPHSTPRAHPLICIYDATHIAALSRTPPRFTPATQPLFTSTTLPTSPRAPAFAHVPHHRVFRLRPPTRGMQHHMAPSTTTLRTPGAGMAYLLPAEWMW